MFSQNRAGIPFLSIATLAVFFLLSVVWVGSLPTSEPAAPSIVGTVETSDALPPVDQDPYAPQPLVAEPIAPLPPQDLVIAAREQVADTLRIPKAYAAPVRVGEPVHLTIESAGIDYPVYDLGLLPDGKLDAPKDGKTLGWYRLGPKPGQRGNAVIDGHLTTAEGKGAFWNLKLVKAGDIVSVTDDAGITRRFRVRQTVVYHVNHAPMQEIFGKSDGRHLNLITCAGVWDTAIDHYDKRLIVYTDLVE